MNIKDFRDLDVWNKGKEIVRVTYNITTNFPKDELYTLTSQMRRSAMSIPSNVAEGFNRQYNKEYCQFLYTALGSCAELETQCEIAYDLKYLDEEKKNNLLDQIQHESKMLTNLIKRIKNN